MDHTKGIENELIEGRNAITEALRAGRPIDKIYISGGDGDKTLGFISTVAREKGITVVECDRRKLDFMVCGGVRRNYRQPQSRCNYPVCRVRRRTRCNHPETPQCRPDRSGEQGFCRGCGAFAGSPRTKPSCSTGGTQGKGHLDLRYSGGWRQPALGDRTHRTHCARDRIRGHGYGTTGS